MKVDFGFSYWFGAYWAGDWAGQHVRGDRRVDRSDEETLEGSGG